MRAHKSFVGFPLILQHPLQLHQQLVDVLRYVVGSSGVLLPQIIGGLPLVDEVLGVRVVEPVVVVEDSFPDFEVSKTDASGETAQVIDSDVVPPEEIEDLIGVGVRESENFLFGEAGVV